MTNPSFFSKFTSRKLWAAVATSAIVLVGNHVGVPDEILQMVVNVVSAFIIGQAVVDTATAIKK